MIPRCLPPLLLLVLLIGGSGASHSAPSVEPVTPAPSEGEVFEWAWSPSVGTRGRFKIWRRLVSARHVAVQRGGQKRREEAVEVHTAEVDYETISRDDRGATVSRLIFRRITTSRSLKRGGKSVPGPNAQATAQLERAAIGVQVDVKRGPEGDLWNVQGVQGGDALSRRLKSAAAKLARDHRALWPRVLETLHTDLGLVSEWDAAEERPPGPVRVGEAWRSEYVAANPPAAVYEVPVGTTHWLKSLTPARATLAHRFDFASRPVGNTARDAARTSGTLLGQAVIDRATGLPLEETSSFWLRSQRDHDLSWARQQSRRVFTLLALPPPP